MRVGSHTGYDRLVLTFGSDPVPEFTVTPQRTATFPMDPSDDLVTLRGQTGVRVVVQSTLLAPTALVDDMRPGYPAIREVQQIGNFEAVVSYAVGVGGSSALVRVSTLASPNRLVIDVAPCEMVRVRGDPAARRASKDGQKVCASDVAP